MKKELSEQVFGTADARFEQMLKANLAALQKEKPMKKKMSLALVLCLSLLALSGVALALSELGVLSFHLPYMSQAYYQTLPDAEALVQKDLAELTVGTVKIKAKEMVYDGRQLQILYSVTDTTVKTPFTEAEKQDIVNGGVEGSTIMAGANAVFECDMNGQILVNGQKVNLTSSAMQAGDAPGEYVFLIQSRLENSQTGEKMRLTGGVPIELKLMDAKDVHQQVEALRFTLQAGDVATRYTKPLPAPVLVDACEVAVTDLHVSPVSVTIEYEVSIPAQSLHGDQEAVDKYAELFAMEGVLQNANGEALGTGKASEYSVRQLADGGAVICYYNEFAPSEKTTDTVFMCVHGTEIALDVH